MNIVRNTWWQSPKSKRVFVIVGVWFTNGTISSLEILEQGMNQPKELAPESFLEQVDKNELIELIQPTK